MLQKRCGVFLMYVTSQVTKFLEQETKARSSSDDLRARLTEVMGDSRLQLSEKHDREEMAMEENFIRRERPRYGAVEPTSKVN